MRYIGLPYLSVQEFLQVLRAFRRGGAIVSPLQAQGMFDNGFGIDLTRDTRIGTMYAKDGWWMSDQQQVEQSKVFLLPRSMELVILINSPACADTPNVFNLVADAIGESMELRVAALLSKVVGRLFGG